MIILDVIAVIGQVFTHVYFYLTIDDYKIFEDYHYLSLMSAMGIGTFMAYALVFADKIWMKLFLILFTLLLSATIGHASAFLSTFIIIIPFLIVKLKMNIPAMFGSLILLLILFFLVLPSFSDVNAWWRIIYWRETITESILINYGILGYGFGDPYVSQEIAAKFSDEIMYSFENVGTSEVYLAPANNFLMTIIHHLGFVPAFLVLLPLKDTFKWFLTRKNKADFNKNIFSYFLYYVQP